MTGIGRSKNFCWELHRFTKGVLRSSVPKITCIYIKIFFSHEKKNRKKKKANPNIGSFDLIELMEGNPLGNPNGAA